MKEKIKNLGVYKLYSILFLLIYLIVFIPTSLRNLNIGFTGLFTDGFTQHVVFMRDFIGNIKDWLFNRASFPMFDFNLGLGADTIASYGYYGLFDPFNIIAIILPLKWIEFSFYLILFIKMYLSGLFFIMFAKNILLKNKWALCTSGLLYIFNSCMLLSILRHPIFAGCFMILPLVLLGANRVIENKRPYILIFSTFYALVSQFYLYAYIALAFEIFVFVKSFKGKNQKKEYLLTLVKTNLWFLLGTLLGAFVLFAQIYAVLNSGRSTGNVMINYSTGYYATLIFAYLLPVPAMSYGNSIGNFIAVFLVMLFFTTYKKEKWLKIWLGIQLPLLLVSVFGYALSLFAYVNNRWAFILIAPICLVTGLMIENIEKIEKKDACNIIKTCVYLAIFGVALGINYAVKNFLKVELMFSLLLRASNIIAFSLITYYVHKKDFSKIKLKNYTSYTFSIDFLKVTTTLIFLFNIGMCFCLTEGYAVNKYYKNEFSADLIDEKGFYRVSKYSYAGGFIKHANDSIYGDYSSTFFYDSINNSNILDFVEYFNINNENANVGYNGVGKRYILETISGVKYYIAKDSENRSSPYNFEYIGSLISNKLNDKDLNIIYDTYLKEDGKNVKETVKVYENKNTLPLGFAYNTYINKKDLDKLTPLQRQTYLSKAVILEKYIESIDYYSTPIYTNSISSLPYEITKTHGLSIKDGIVKVNDKDNFIEISVINNDDSELYLEFNGIQNENPYNKTIVNYTSDDENWIETIFYLGENFYIDNSDHLLYMGYDKFSNSRTLKIQFKHTGTYFYDSLNIYSLSMNEMKDDVNKLKYQSLENIKITPNNIKGDITMNSNGVLFLSIPYNEGFKAYVDGKEAELLKANITYMGIELNEGYHTIELRYETPYLNTGLKVSFASFIILAAISITDITIYLKKKKKAQ